MKKNEFIEKYGENKYKDLLNNNNNKRKTFIGRAKHLIESYIQQDKKYNRGECTLTPEQLIGLWENGCYWCGEKDWNKLGADRIDEKKPHTLENCVCACSMCNSINHLKSRRKQILQLSKDGKLIKIWDCSYDIEKELGYPHNSILNCCKHKYGFKTAYGYKWDFKN